MNYRLLSTGLVHTPGIIAWAKNGYHFPRDRAAMLRVICEGYKVPRAAAKALLSGSAPYTVDLAGTVHFTFPVARLTQTQVKAELAALGVAFRRTDLNEYRVCLKGLDESAAAYESDLKSALDTGKAMANRPYTPANRSRAIAALDVYRGRA